ncbi:hypothetical protein [Mycobacterium deserti]|uniref:Uncharacterized protein n=1 Tax=Mycobacterium deserti TaxID=2978347 RepID=A0ABT2MGR3_9MYCO|nr:hypothetical protein [Mycobacterium deserti]MCT7661476.1 hypothetical protein [Mycobacterium deserti]
MVEREASGDFDYLFDDPAEPPASGGDLDEADEWDGFDAFDSNTWYFEPAPTPWYRTTRAMWALLSTAAAAIAIVVSGVLLVFQPGQAVEDSTGEPPVTPTATSTAERTRLATSSAPPPAPPPPPTASQAPVQQAPPQTRQRSPSRSTTTKEPEIGVTRTPATRSPISVAPQRPNQR